MDETKDRLFTPKLYAATYGKQLGRDGGPMCHKSATNLFREWPFSFKRGQKYFAWESDILKWGRDN